MLLQPSSAPSSWTSRVGRSTLWWLGALIILSQLWYWKIVHDAQQSPQPLADERAAQEINPRRIPDDREALSSRAAAPAIAPQLVVPPAVAEVITLPTAAVATTAEVFLPPLPPARSLLPDARYENHVFVYQQRWREAVQDARNGGPAGELFLYETALRALLFLQQQQPNLRLRVHKLHNRTELERALDDVQRLAAAASESPSTLPHRVLGVYTQTFDLVAEGGAVFSHALIRPCAYRWLDFWGTPEEQNGIKQHLRQFLTPYDFGYNAHLGFVVEPPPLPGPDLDDAVYAPRLCLWGKAAKYFPPDRFTSLQYALDHLPSTLTKPTVHAAIAQPVSPPAWVVNHGVQASPPAFHAYLSSCTVLVGMGDPILGPTVFQAIAHGAVYLNYAYSAAKRFWMNGRMQLRSQHDEAEKMMRAQGKQQWVRTVQWEGRGGRGAADGGAG